MIDHLARQAILCALDGDWERARSINEKILELDNSSVDALNRLAKALFELGSIESALSCVQKTLEIDPLNGIAQKCVRKWSSIDPSYLVANTKSTKYTFSFIAELYLEEPGKTKTVKLLNLGDKKLILTLDTGSEVTLSYGEHRVSAVTSDGKYIGCIPDDLSKKIIETTKSGSLYKALIKSTSAHEVSIFLKEFKT